MNIFKNTTFTWWQLSIFKIAVFFIGISCGIFFEKVLEPYLIILLATGLTISVYSGYIWSRNK